MADLDAQLSISADASGVEAGIGAAQRKLADLGKSAATAGKEASKGLEGMGEGAAKAEAKVNRTTARLITSIQQATAAAEAGSRSSAAYFEALGKQRGVDPATLRPYLSALDEANAKQAAAVAQMVKGGNELNKYGQTARQTAAALRQVPAQLTDIIVGLQGGQAPLTVLLQQGGQLRDVFGGVVPAVRALGGAVLGLINPFTLTAAAAVGLYAAYEQGAKEAREFSNALVLTNNISGVTVGQLNEMAVAVSRVSGTQGQAAAALTEFVRAGIRGTEGLQEFAAAAIKLERSTGQSVGQTAKNFAELQRAPLQALLKLNEGTNFLTESVYRQVKSLEEQGRTIEAARVATEAYNREVRRVGDGVDSLGSLERAWKAVSDEAKAAWDNMLNIGRPELLENRLAKARKLLEDWEKTMPGKRTTAMVSGMADAGGEDNLRNQIAGMEELLGNQRKAAETEAERTKREQARIKFIEEGNRYLKDNQKMQLEIGKVEQLRLSNIISQAEAEERIRVIRASYAKQTPDTTRVDARARTLLDIEGIQKAAADQVNAYTNAERVLDALRSSGLASETAYYAEKRRLLEETTRVQMSALEQENERLSREKLNTKDSLDRDRQVLENKSKIAKLQADAATQSIILNIQESAAIQARTTALISARQAQEDYLASLDRQQRRDLEGIGKGQRQRDYDQGIGQIEDKYSQQRRDLENQRALALAIAGERGLTKEQADQFDERLRLLDEFQQKAIQSYSSYYDQITKKQSNWALGASEALANYTNDAQNLFAQTRKATESAFQGMEDALVTFVTTGKLSFKSLADSIVQDITRIIIKQQMMNLATSAISSLGLGSLLGTGGTAAVASAMSGNSLDNFLKLNNNFASFDGGGYTGNSPRLGGLDGRGGFLAMLHPRETVVDHSRGQTGMQSRTFAVTINQNFPPGTSTKTTLQAASQARRQLEVASRNM